MSGVIKKYFNIGSRQVHAAPAHIQKQLVAAAEKKRARKLDRPGGWYNG